MILIFNKETITGKEKELEAFRQLYENAFPDPDEREEFQTILTRVSEEPIDDNPYTFIILSTQETNHGSIISGGIIADWYKGCPAIHLTYIVVSLEARGKKVGNTLINKGIPEIKATILKEYGNELKHVFFESNIPWMTEIDSFDAETRLLIFHKLGAKWIDIPYVQPPLDPTKEKVKNLFLLVFPDSYEVSGKVGSDETKEVLKNLYLGLGIKDPEKDTDFHLMMESIQSITDDDGNLLLTQIPGEFPRYKFYGISVTIHLIEDSELLSDSYAAKNDSSDNLKTHCKRFYSYEKDLLNFQSQIKPPFASSLVLEGDKNKVKIKFPEYYSYTSEGRTRKIFTNRAEVSANLAISDTLFYNSGIRIWHLTFSPGDNKNYFSEYDIIKLACYFGSSQENSEMGKLIRFKISGNEKVFEPDKLLTIYGLVDNEVKLLTSNTGIVEIDSEMVKFSDDSPVVSFVELYAQFSDPGGIRPVIFTKKYYEDNRFEDLMNTFCGITLGIFDFHRMDSQEVIDTLRPINVNSDSFMIITRGNLLSISKEDEILEDVLPGIGISPYLLIPSSYLAHNEYTVSSIKKQVDKVLEEIGKDRNISLAVLEEILRDSQDKLNNKYLTSPFQYPTETNIVKEGFLQRGIENLAIYVKLRIEELSIQINQKTHFRATIIEAAMTSFLLLISILQIYSLIESWFINKNMFRIGFIILSLFFMAGFFLLFLGKNNWMNNFFRIIFSKKRSKSEQIGSRFKTRSM